MNNVYAIVTAAGSSRRMGVLGDKLAINIKGRPVVALAVEAFFRAGIPRAIVVVPKHKWEFFNHLFSMSPVELVVGGGSRQESVYQGLKSLTGRCSHVLIHDGARPNVSGELIARVYQGALDHDACIPGLPTVDTTYRVQGQSAVEVVPRGDLVGVQTPQGFSYDLIMRAHEYARSVGLTGTDDGGLVLAMGHRPFVVPGEQKNTKITTPEDVELLNAHARTARVGYGVDIHRLVEGRPLILGGVTVPSIKGLLGHSDADVVIHALMDALLGAVGDGDIGVHFPDTDSRYKGISSLELLEQVEQILRAKGAVINNVDITLLLERPKIAPHREQMRDKIAAALKIPRDLVSVKATTGEGLGFVGGGDGAVCHAVASVTV